MKILDNTAAMTPQTNKFRLPLFKSDDLKAEACLAAQEPKTASAILSQKLGALHVETMQANAEAFALCQQFMSDPLAVCEEVEASGSSLEQDESLLAMSGMDDLRDEKNTLESQLELLEQARTRMMAFRVSKKLNYACRFPNKLYALLIEGGMVTVESAINASIMAALSSYGGAESIVYAATVSVLNVGFGTLSGWALCQTLDQSRKSLWRFQTLSAVLIVSQVGFACFVAGLVSVADQGVFDPAQSVATLFHSARLFPWEYSMDGLRLWGITLIFGAVSTFTTYKKAMLFEPFPGYAEASKPYHDLEKKMRGEYRALLKKLEAQRPALPDGPLPEPELARDVRLLAGSLKKLKSCVQDYEATEAHNRRVYETASNTLLGHFEILAGKQKMALSIQSLPLRAPELQQQVSHYEAFLKTQQATLRTLQESRKKQLSALHQAHAREKEEYIKRLSEAIFKIRQGKPQEAKGFTIEDDEDPAPSGKKSNVISTGKWGE